MRLSIILAALSVISGAVLAQSGGTITGTVTDPAGALVAGAPIEAVNTATNAKYPVASSATGNYTLAELPAGNYTLTISVPGFKKFNRVGLELQAAQTIRVDASLEVGNATESVTVSEAAPLLKTESGEFKRDSLDAVHGPVAGAPSRRGQFRRSQPVRGNGTAARGAGLRSELQ